MKIQDLFIKTVFEILSGFLNFWPLSSQTVFSENRVNGVKSAHKTCFPIFKRLKGFFDTPFDLSKEKMFSSHRRVNVYFLWTKKSKKHVTTQYFIKYFYKQVLDIHRPVDEYLRPFQNFRPHIWASKALATLQ